MKNPKFDDMRPYYDEEIPAAMQRIADSTSFALLASYVYPGKNIDKVREQIRAYSNVRDFQLEVMRCVNEQVLERSSTDFTFSGIEKLDPNKKYLFVSNHRDIMLDACLLQYVLYKNGHETSEITFGANLMQGQLVTDIGKSNKMFKVERPGMSPREFYKASLHLSEYIRHTLIDNKESVWIAQRNGRTKDGIDRTDQGIIKMFGMSYQGDKVDALTELNIVPISISYEWESCDILKALELYQSRSAKYIKKPGEDLNSILTGIVQPKGRIHIEFCDLITRDDLMQFNDCTAGDYHRQVANLIDCRICSAYRLTPNNYIAHDLRYGKQEYVDRYTEQEKQTFVDYLKRLQQYEETCNIDELSDILLGIYSNPIESKLIFK
ncbi:MAG: 1-acyl-sn-glycerol-3-phosphate acyltransferase [Bacteroidales bacterium]|nr:1-acyl-sn-glycerol-3-phosphate acyltransferase [Bacteroidales bacterium]